MAETATPATEVDIRKPGFAVSLLGAALPGLYLLITSTTTLVSSIWPYDFKRMLEFGLLLAVCLLPAFNRNIGREFNAVVGGIPRWTGLSLVGLGAWGALSAIVNAQSPMHLANSLSEVALFATLVLSALVLGACRRLSGLYFDKVAVGLIALMALTVGVQDLLGVLAAHSANVDFSFRISLLHFSWPRFYNQVQSWTVLVVGAIPLLFPRYSVLKLLCLIALALQWYIILMTGARGSAIALGAGILLVVVLLPVARGAVLRWQISGALLGGILFLAVLQSFDSASPLESVGNPAVVQDSSGTSETSYFDGGEKGTSAFAAQSVGRDLFDPMGRQWMWRLAWQDARDHPVLGIGPMNYACTSPAHLGHPHNFVLQWAAEWGMPAALGASVLIAVLLLSGIMQVRRNPPPGFEGTRLAAILLGSATAATVHALVSGVFVMPASQVAGLAVLGMLVGLRNPGQLPVVEPRRASRLWLVGLLLSCGLLVLGVQELRTMEERANSLRPGEDLWPRMWQNAKVCRIYVDNYRVN